MAKPIYKMYMLRLIEPWYQLSEEQQASMLEKVDAARKAVGGKQVLLCDSAWASEQWQGFGIEVFPSVDALQKHAQLLLEIGWYRYIESDTVLGTNSADFVTGVEQRFQAYGQEGKAARLPAWAIDK